LFLRQRLQPQRAVATVSTSWRDYLSIERSHNSPEYRAERAKLVTWQTVYLMNAGLKLLPITVSGYRAQRFNIPGSCADSAFGRLRPLSVSLWPDFAA
jgi:hypothetical protein